LIDVSRSANIFFILLSTPYYAALLGAGREKLSFNTTKTGKSEPGPALSRRGCIGPAPWCLGRWFHFRQILLALAKSVKTAC